MQILLVFACSERQTSEMMAIRNSYPKLFSLETLGEKNVEGMDAEYISKGSQWNNVLCLSCGILPDHNIKPKILIDNNKVISGDYITIHHGWDEDHKIKSGLHTKC